MIKPIDAYRNIAVLLSAGQFPGELAPAIVETHKFVKHMITALEANECPPQPSPESSTVSEFVANPADGSP